MRAERFKFDDTRIQKLEFKSSHKQTMTEQQILDLPDLEVLDSDAHNFVTPLSTKDLAILLHKLDSEPLLLKKREILVDFYSQ